MPTICQFALPSPLPSFPGFLLCSVVVNMVHGSRLEPQTATATANRAAFDWQPCKSVLWIALARWLTQFAVLRQSHVALWCPLSPPPLPKVSSSFSFSFSVCQNNFPFQIWHDHLEWACLDWLPRLSALMNFRVCLLISWAHYFHSALCQEKEREERS